MKALAAKVIEVCRMLAQFSEEPGRTTRTFLSPPMHDVHRVLGDWMHALAMDVWVDAAGNLHGLREPSRPGMARLLLGSHLDTVRNAGAFDGILGVVSAVALVEAVGNVPPFALEVVGFSEEEGVRFRFPFIGSRALTGTLERRGDVDQATREFGLDPEQLGETRLHPDTRAFFEIHIEQGPLLENLGLPLGVVDRVVGQSRLSITFEGSANHAGTTSMALRRDALAAASEWIGAVEQYAAERPPMVATVGKLEVTPNTSNVIPGSAQASLDVRHPCDEIRQGAVRDLLAAAQRICARRGLALAYQQILDQSAVAMDAALVAHLERAVCEAGYPTHRMSSGAGHDAMIMAPHVPSVMLFVRSPGGISHHPAESVRIEDVEAALRVGLTFIRSLELRLA